MASPLLNFLAVGLVVLIVHHTLIGQLVHGPHVLDGLWDAVSVITMKCIDIIIGEWLLVISMFLLVHWALVCLCLESLHVGDGTRDSISVITL